MLFFVPVPGATTSNPVTSSNTVMVTDFTEATETDPADDTLTMSNPVSSSNKNVMVTDFTEVTETDPGDDTSNPVTNGVMVAGLTETTSSTCTGWDMAGLPNEIIWTIFGVVTAVLLLIIAMLLFIICRGKWRSKGIHNSNYVPDIYVLYILL